MHTLGEKIRSARKRAEMTLQRAAEGIGVSHPYWSRIESGDTLPAPEKLPLIAEMLGLDLVELQALEASERGRIVVPEGVDPSAIRKALETLGAQPATAEAHDPHACECPRCGARLKLVE
jgi:transcriptional regulator with XRE-family HTH domain